MKEDKEIEEMNIKIEEIEDVDHLMKNNNQ